MPYKKTVSPDGGTTLVRIDTDETSTVPSKGAPKGTRKKKAPVAPVKTTKED